MEGTEIRRKKKKAKREEEEEADRETNEKHRKEKRQKKTKTKTMPTVNIAVAGSIIDNAQSLELATRLAGQIARAATIFRIDEVVVFDTEPHSSDGGSIVTTEDDGITLQENHTNLKGTLVDVGLSKNVVVDQVLEAGQRITVAMGTDRNVGTEGLKEVVTSMSPREEMGLCWGYRVRYASNLSSVFKGCPHKGGYDHVIGTSEHGRIVSSSELIIPSFRHLLIAFGGLAGLEESIEEDNALKGKDVREVFGSYLNICPHQGSRTIRTEEAIFISLQYFQEPIMRAVQQFDGK